MANASCGAENFLLLKEKKEKKNVTWVDDDEIDEVFYFECDKTEGVQTRRHKYLQLLKQLELESFEMPENEERIAIPGIKSDEMGFQDENVLYETEAFYLRRIIDWIERGKGIVYCVPKWSGGIPPSAVGYLPIGLSEKWNSEILHHCVYIYSILTFNKMGIKIMIRNMKALHFLLNYTKRQQPSALLEEQNCHKSRKDLISCGKKFSRKFKKNRKSLKELMKILHHLFIEAVTNDTNHKSELRFITFEEVVSMGVIYNTNMKNCKAVLDDFLTKAYRYMHISENESSRTSTDSSLIQQN